MARELFDVELTPEQELEAAQIEDVLNGQARMLNRQMARLLASKPNRQLLGETEFQIRDAVHRLGAAGIEAALSERKKRGTKGPASSAPAAEKMPASNATPDANSKPS